MTCSFVSLTCGTTQHALCSFHLIGSDCFLHKSHLSAVLTLTQAYSDWVDSAARTWCRRRIQNHLSANSSAHKQSTAKMQLNATRANSSSSRQCWIPGPGVAASNEIEGFIPHVAVGFLTACIVGQVLTVRLTIRHILVIPNHK